MSRRPFLYAVIAAAAMVSACATVPTDPDEKAEFEALNDPFEPMNRTVFDANMFLDEKIMVPVAKAYRETMPADLQSIVHNMLNNLGQPYVAGNDLLQGKLELASDSLSRFVLNSTWGLLGMFDVAAIGDGPKGHDNDIGTTLGVWGVEEGPYLMLPFVGPASVRDTVGRVADNWSSPAGQVLIAEGLGWVNDVRFGVDLVDSRVRLLDPLDDLKRNSIDLYAAVRSTYRQRREAMVGAGDGVGGTPGSLPGTGVPPSQMPMP